MSKEFSDYPKGRLSQGSGDLIDVFDITQENEDGEETVSTLRNNPAGSTSGKRKSTLTFKSALSEVGFERDFFDKWRKREVVQLRLKVPGKTITQTGRYTKPKITSNVDGFIEFEISHIGKMNAA